MTDCAAWAWARRITARRAASSAATRSRLPLAFEVFGAELLDPHAFLGRLHPQPRLNLRLACGVELGATPSREDDVEDRTRAGSGGVQLGGGALGVGRRIAHALGDGGVGPLEALHLGGGGFGLHPGQPSFSVWAARCASNSRNALRAEAARSLAACSCVRCWASALREVLDEFGDPGERGVGGIAVGDEFQPGAFGAGAAAQHEPAEHVARLGDDRERRGVARLQIPPDGARGSQVIGDDDVREQCPARRPAR